MLVLSAISASAEIVDINTPSSSIVLDATEGRPLKFLYYGPKLAPADAAALKSAGGPRLNAYPAYGMTTVSETAVATRHADGNMTLDLNVASVKRDGLVTTITLKDTYYPFTVDVNYRTWPDSEVIETWTEISHDEPSAVTLTQFASGYLPVRFGDVWLSSFWGNWGNEAQLEQQPLTHGVKSIKNKDGIRNSHYAHSEIMLSLDGKPREESGRTIGAALCYSGNYLLRIDTDHSSYHHFFAGINDENSEYHLAPGEQFVTPVLALTYSEEGTGGASRNFHRWGRAHRMAHGDRERKILLNSWEGVYFDIKEKEMAQMMSDIADLGGELFVMDDGWFGPVYRRDNDKAALGDWTVDTRKLPHGIKGLTDAARKRGIRFGIWIEPEMTDTMSLLYREHPEYVVEEKSHKTQYGRGGNQIALDMGNPAVQDIVFSIVDTLLTKYPEIDYIKWDANACIKNHGSAYLTSDKQSHLYIDYHRGLAATLDRIRAKYPDVTIQACAGGGGRANWGVMPWFDEFWVSDNTDALQRIFIQWGTSYFYPAIAMASHISATPNHQTQRTIPLKFRTDVAMSGRLGMEMQPKDMTEAEKAQCRKAIAEYKEIRPIVQFGDLYRLVSPYDHKGVASLLYAAPEKDKAVFFWWRTENFRNKQYPRVVMSGLDPDRTYRVREINRIDRKPLSFEGKSFSGRFLMSTGLELPVTHNLPAADRTEYSSRVLLLESN